MTGEVKFDIDFHDVVLPVSTTFGELDKGPAVLYGLNLENYNLRHLRIGKIMDRRGSIVKYLPNVRLNSAEKNKLKALPKNALVWLSGKYDRGIMSAQGFGEKKDFPYARLAESIEERFKRHFDTDVFTYVGKYQGSYRFLVKGTIKVNEMDEDMPIVTILNSEGREVTIIAENGKRFVPFKGKKVKFEATMARPGINGAKYICPILDRK